MNKQTKQRKKVRRVHLYMDDSIVAKLDRMATTARRNRSKQVEVLVDAAQ